MNLVSDLTATQNDPARRCAVIFGQEMQPCPTCGGYNIKHQTPIQISEPLPDDLDARKMLGVWARARKAGATPLEGPVYLMCFDCFHKGPSVDCSGRTREDVGQDPAVNAEIKRLWNSQDNAQISGGTPSKEKEVHW